MIHAGSADDVVDEFVEFAVGAAEVNFHAINSP
jgi:hypothetical protein